MNKFYRVIWNRTTGRWIVVSELASSRRKNKITKVRTSLLTPSCLFTAGTVIMLSSCIASAHDYTEPMAVYSGTFTFPAGEANTLSNNTKTLDYLLRVQNATALSTSDLTLNAPNRAGIGVSDGGVFNNTGLTTINSNNNDTAMIGVWHGGKATFADIVINETGTNPTPQHSALTVYTGGTLTSSGKITISSNSVQFAILAYDNAVVNLNTVDISLRNNNSYGIGVGAKTNFTVNGGKISTSGTNSHGFAALSGGKQVFDGTSGHILPTITVTGAGSAMLNASGAGSQLTLNNQTLNISGASAADTWGAKAEGAGTVLFNGGSTGGTGLWSTGANSTVSLTSNADASGSRVKLNTSGVLSLGSATTKIGSLEGYETGNVAAATAGNGLTIGANNATNNGSLQDNANYAGKFTGIGLLTKTGSTTQILSGLYNTVGSVDVTGGTLKFSQAGAFTTTGDFTTRTGATTALEPKGAALVVGGKFTQEANSTLRVALGAKNDITAKSATLAGKLDVAGFAAGPEPVKASDVTTNAYTLIHTTDGITGDFTNTVGIQPTGMDYLLQSGYVSADKLDYKLGFHMAWNLGGQAYSTGNFTVNDGTAFNVDTVLADQTAPAGGFTSGWDGKSLTKAGAGLLALSAVNTYTGKTTLSAGTLRTDVADTIASSNELAINGGVFDLNGNNQKVNRLNGSGGEVQLNGGTLTANNATATDNTTFAGDIVDGNKKSSLTKTGDGSLTLSGKTGWTGDTHIDGGELVLDGSKGGGQLVSNIIAKDNTALSLRNGATLTGWIDPTDVNIDTTSTWNMTADSVVDNVNLAGTINFVAPATSPMTAGRTLTANNWNGQGGTVVLNTVLGNDTSVTDKIVVNGNTSGNTLVKVNNLGGSGAQTVEGIKIVQVKGASDGTFEKSGRIVAGAYDYSVVKKGSDWYLSTLLKDAPVTPAPLATPVAPDAAPTPDAPAAQDTPHTDVTPQNATVRPESASYTANLAAANTMFTTRLHDRLGETQYTDVLTGEKKVTSMWLRQVGGHNSWKDSSGQLSTQSNRYVAQLGGDIAQWSSDGLQRLHLGVMAGYGNDSNNSQSNKTGYRSEGSVNGYSAGLYATWYQNDDTRQGIYVDSWAQYGWFNNKVKGQDIQGESYKSSGITASLETGYTHKLGEFHGSAGSLQEWYIQPQAQAIWMGVKADDHRESNGTHVTGEGDGNLQTRLGVRTYLKGHSKIDDGKNRTFQPFVEVNWIHNTQDFGTRMDGVSVSQNGARNIGEVKTGVEGQLSTRLDVWGNVGVQVGDKGYNDTSAMLGVKYSF